MHILHNVSVDAVLRLRLRLRYGGCSYGGNVQASFCLFFSEAAVFYIIDIVLFVPEDRTLSLLLNDDFTQ